MPALRYTPAAVADIDGIWNYSTERWGDVQAEIYIRQLDETCHSLAEGILPGIDAGDIRPGYRKQISGRHVIFYRTEEDGSIDIVRILHHAMDATARIPKT